MVFVTWINNLDRIQDQNTAHVRRTTSCTMGNCSMRLMFASENSPEITHGVGQRFETDKCES